MKFNNLRIIHSILFQNFLDEVSKMINQIYYYFGKIIFSFTIIFWFQKFGLGLIKVIKDILHLMGEPDFNYFVKKVQN